MATFKAIRIDRTDGGRRVGIADFDDADLMEGDVTVRVTHSTVNYKDGLAITGRSPVVRRFPMIPGIDFSGVVEQSSHALFQAGDAVIHVNAPLHGEPPREAGLKSRLDHVAFDCTGPEAFAARLKGAGVAFRSSDSEAGGLRQFVLHDPNGLKVELTFRL